MNTELTQEEIIEGNKLIALFDGYELTGKDHPFDPELGPTLRKKGHMGVTWAAKMQYHKSYDWLIPVMRKFVAIPVSTVDEDAITVFKNEVGYFEAVAAVTPIKLLFTELVNAIKWYNQFAKP